MNLIISICITAIAVGLTSYLLPGVAVAGAGSAVLVAVVLAVVNTFLKPVLLLLTLPINVVTIGLFTFVINALIILLVSQLVPGFKVNGFWWALLFSLVLSVVNAVLFSIFK